MYALFLLFFLLPCSVRSITPCGQRRVTSGDETARAKRIAGGQPVGNARWPWQVSLRSIWSIPSCGGTIIGARWVLTAAHCLRPGFPIEITAGTNAISHDDTPQLEDKLARIGSEKNKASRRPPTIRVSSSFFVFPTFDRRKSDFDIGLIEIDEPFVFDDHIQPICLPTNDLVIGKETTGWLTGWGDTTAKRSPSFVLRQAEMTILDDVTCQKLYRTEDVEYRPQTMLCAGDVDGASPCRGDSGGPLMVESSGKENATGSWFQYGVSSFGSRRCGQQDRPAVFTRVSAYCDFISVRTNGEVECIDPEE